jgi:hypothetical protein
LGLGVLLASVLVIAGRKKLNPNVRRPEFMNRAPQSF